MYRKIIYFYLKIKKKLKYIKIIFLNIFCNYFIRKYQKTKLFVTYLINIAIIINIAIYLKLSFELLIECVFNILLFI